MFEENNTNTNTAEENALAALVGEGKKFQTVEDLAKGKVAADEYIQQLQSETQQYREMLQQATDKDKEKMDQILEALRKPENANAPVTPNDNARTRVDVSNLQDKDNNPFNEDRLVEMVGSLLDKREQQSQTERNLNMVQEKLTSMYGDKASKAVADKAAELGMPVSGLQSMAEQNPNVLLALMGSKDETPSNDQSVSFAKNNVNTEAQVMNDKGEVRNRQWWNAQRNEKGKKWFYQPANQQLYMQDMNALGNQF